MLSSLGKSFRQVELQMQRCGSGGADLSQAVGGSVWLGRVMAMGHSRGCSLWWEGLQWFLSVSTGREKGRSGASLFCREVAASGKGDVGTQTQSG